MGLTKNEIDEVFRTSGKVKVIFQKADRSLRTMICTTNLDAVPIEAHPKGTGAAKSEDVKPVFDLDKGAWRSFRYDSVIEFSELND